MSPPTLWYRFRQIIGRALRETGQALDRFGIQTTMLIKTQNTYYDDPMIYQDYLSRHRHIFPLLTSGKPIIDYNVAYLAPCSTLIGSVVIKSGVSIWYGSILRADCCENVESLFINSSTSEQQKQQQQQQLGKVDDTTSTTTSIPTIDNDNDKIIYWKDNKEIWKLDSNRIEEYYNTLQYDKLGGGIFINCNTNIQDNCIITSRINHCIIGSNVTIGHSTQIHSATIGNNTLIGMGSIILPNVNIGNNCYIGAGSVIPSNTIINDDECWVGNPPRKIKNVSIEQREKLIFQSNEYKKLATSQNNDLNNQNPLLLLDNNDNNLNSNTSVHNNDDNHNNNKNDNISNNKTIVTDGKMVDR